MSQNLAADPQPQTEGVVLVHGLWMRGFVMRRLGSYLGKSGFRTQRFSYPTRKLPLEILAERLKGFCESQAWDRLHIVAHSMGGIITLKMLSQSPSVPPGRVVLLGSPVAGSQIAKRIMRVKGGRSLFGLAGPTLAEGFAHAPPDRETGLIVGTKSAGLGTLVGGFSEPGDGTVALSDTDLQGAADRIEMHVTHTGMVFSRPVAAAVERFLKTGRFHP